MSSTVLVQFTNQFTNSGFCVANILSSLSIAVILFNTASVVVDSALDQAHNTFFVACIQRLGTCVYGSILDNLANILAFDASFISQALPAILTHHSNNCIASQIRPAGSSLNVFFIFSNPPYLSVK
jgi:hypothetical protein